MIHSSWISLSLIGFRALCLYYPVICQSVHSSVAWDLSTLHDKQLFCIIVKCRHPSESTRERVLKGCLHAYRCLWPCTLCSKYTWTFLDACPRSITGMITWPWCLQLSTSVSAAECNWLLTLHLKLDFEFYDAVCESGRRQRVLVYSLSMLLCSFTIKAPTGRWNFSPQVDLFSSSQCKTWWQTK